MIEVELSSPLPKKMKIFYSQKDSTKIIVGNENGIIFLWEKKVVAFFIFSRLLSSKQNNMNLSWATRVDHLSSNFQPIVNLRK